ncbi:hypothetical protein ES703_97856 [subsurface metagenome]
MGGDGGDGAGGTGGVVGDGAGTGIIPIGGAVGCTKDGGGNAVVNEPAALQALFVSELMALTFQ